MWLISIQSSSATSAPVNVYTTFPWRKTVIALSASFLLSIALFGCAGVQVPSFPTSNPDNTKIIRLRDLGDNLEVYEVSPRYNALTNGVSYVQIGVEDYDTLFRRSAEVAASVQQLRYTVDHFNQNGFSFSSPGDALFLRDMTAWGIQAIPDLVSAVPDLLRSGTNVITAPTELRDVGFTKIPAIIQGARLAVTNLEDAERQIQGLANSLGDVSETVRSGIELPDVQRLISGFTPNNVVQWASTYVTNIDQQPLTTNLDMAYSGDIKLDNDIPGDPIPLLGQPRDANGVFFLVSGIYEYNARSYCLKAGAHGQSRGRGYLPAALTGPKASVIETILRNAAQWHGEVSQRDVQVLLWAIIAQKEYDDMPLTMQQTASRLLPPGELVKLNGGPLSLVGSERLDAFRESVDRQLAPLSEPLQQVFRAEARIRQLASTTALDLPSNRIDFEAFEQLAVQPGDAPPDPDAPDVPYGAWLAHPDGYYVSYRPSRYSHINVRVYVPPSTEGRVMFDPPATVAVPGNRNAQRLGTESLPSERLCESVRAYIEGFDLEDHGYLFSGNPARDFGSDYHWYQLAPGDPGSIPICQTSNPCCTKKNVYKEMLSKRMFMAPVQPLTGANLRVRNCSISNLAPPEWWQYVTQVRFDDKVMHIIPPGLDSNTPSYMARNYTLDPLGPINSHIFHPGRVTRTVEEHESQIWVRTIGEGTCSFSALGDLITPYESCREFNEREGPGIFRIIDTSLRDHFNSLDCGP